MNRRENMKKMKTAYYAGLSCMVLLLLTSCKGGNKEDQNAKKDSVAVVTKLAPGSIIKYDSSKRYIYLTWDDGPQPPGTTICKHIFKDEGVKATFFLVGMHQIDQRRKRIVDSLRNSYPEFLIANHSYSHGFQNKYRNFYSQPDSAVKDFLHAEDELKIPVKIIRLPGNSAWVGNGEMKGAKSVMPVSKRLDSLGYKVIGWDLEWQFISKGGSQPVQSADAMIKDVNRKLDDGNTNEENHIVILAHDRMFEKPQYADSLRKFISVLKQDPRNVFETIDHYPTVQGR